MAIHLYDISVAAYQQTLAAVSGILDRGLKHFKEHNINPEEIVETRLFADMFPFRFQVQSVVHHSVNAIEALKTGQFLPPSGSPPHDYAALQKLVADARETLGKLSTEDVNALEGRDVTFQIRDFKIPFTAANFILSFSLPNFHFHATTTYDILRMKGVPLGKRDYMGPLRMKQ